MKVPHESDPCGSQAPACRRGPPTQPEETVPSGGNDSLRLQGSQPGLRLGKPHELGGCWQTLPNLHPTLRQQLSASCLEEGQG